MTSSPGLPKKTLLLGVLIGVMLSAAAALAAFVYFEMPPLIGDASARTSNASDRVLQGGVCSHLEQLGDADAYALSRDFAAFANRHNFVKHGNKDIRLGRKTSDEFCSLAIDSLAHNLPAAQFEQVTACITAAASVPAVRGCFEL